MLIRSPLMRLLHYRMMKQRMSNFIIITGKKGSGKSYLGMRIGELLQGKGFGLHHVCFSVEELLGLLKSKSVKPGDVVMLEEVGVAANSRDAMTNINKSLSFAAQTIRPERITLIANTITWGLIDTQVKNLADFRIEVIGHDVREKTTEFKFTKISPNQHGQEPFREHLVFDMGKVPIKYVSWTLSQPSKRLREPYEIKRKEYLESIYIKGADAIRGKPKAERRMGIKEQVGMVMSKFSRELGDGTLNAAMLVNEFGWYQSKAFAMSSAAKERWKKLSISTTKGD